MTRILYVCLFLLQALFAQVSNIKGRVTDPSDATVPGAIVTLRKAGARDQRQATDEQGLYEFKVVQAGNYNVRVQKPGFALYSTAGVSISGPSSLDIRLTLATDAQTLKVEDEQKSRRKV